MAEEERLCDMERYYFLGARTGADGGNAAVGDGGGGAGLGIDSDEEDEGVRRATQSERGPVKTLPRRHLVEPRTRMGCHGSRNGGVWYHGPPSASSRVRALRLSNPC